METKPGNLSQLSIRFFVRYERIELVGEFLLTYFNYLSGLWKHVATSLFLLLLLFVCVVFLFLSATNWNHV